MKARLALLALLVLFCLLFVGRPRAEEGVDANIITGLDVSSSINAQETMLQIEGVAQAIRSPEIVAAIRQGQHGRIGFQVFVWADGDYPELVGWRLIAGQADADAASAEILARLQSLIDASSRSVGTLTNLSGAMDHAAALLKDAPFRAGRAVVNIIGNGEDNVGEDPVRARGALIEQGATINGVVVGGDPAVLNYYRNFVRGGKQSFVLSANNTQELAYTFVLKFRSEIAMLELGEQP